MRSFLEKFGEYYCYKSGELRPCLLSLPAPRRAERVMMAASRNRAAAAASHRCCRCNNNNNNNNETTMYRSTVAINTPNVSDVPVSDVPVLGAVSPVHAATLEISVVVITVPSPLGLHHPSTTPRRRWTVPRARSFLLLVMLLLLLCPPPLVSLFWVRFS